MHNAPTPLVLPASLYLDAELGQKSICWMGAAGVYVGSLAPFSDKLLVLGSGLLGVPFWVFLPAYTLGRAVRTYPVALLFWAVGPTLRSWIERYVEIVSAIFVILLALLVIVFGVMAV